MIGHRTPRHDEFGRFAARLDDAANWAPSRLTGALLCAVSWRRAAWRIMRRDAAKHRSPNAGWPEAALAGALGLALAGPRRYAGAWTGDPWLGAEFAPERGGRAAGAADVRAAAALLRRAAAALALLLAGLWAGMGGLQHPVDGEMGFEMVRQPVEGVLDPGLVGDAGRRPPPQAVEKSVAEAVRSDSPCR